jgi:GNAT superfamily N-acetyltransferase
MSIARWVAQGGDAGLFDLVRCVTRAGVFATDDGRAAAAVSPRDPALGTVWDVVGDPGAHAAARDWLVDQGCARVVGPMAACTFFPHRATLGPRDEPPYTGEPLVRPEPWVEAGYSELRRYVSVRVDHDGPIAAAMGPSAGLATSGFHLEALDPASDVGWARLCDGMVDLARDAWRDDPLFAPVPADVLAGHLAGVRPGLDARLLVGACDPDGRLRGLTLAWPDLVAPDRRRFVLRTLFVDPALRDSGLGAWLVGAVHLAARKAGFTSGVHCVLPRTPGEAARVPGRIIREYALFERRLR